MDPQVNTPHNEKIFIGLVLGLILGGVGGYYSGWIIGQTQGIATATENMEHSMPTYKSSAQTAGNPLQDVSDNPLAGVKLNPFE